MGGKLDILRAELRPTDGVLVRSDSNTWHWGCVMALQNAGVLVELFPGVGQKSYTKFVPMNEVYPDEYDFREDDFIPLKRDTTTTTPSPTTSNDNSWSNWFKPIEHVFVYGTLKQKGRLNWALKGCEFIGEDYTKDKKFKMFSVGDRFPAVTTFKGTCAVKGEIYKVDKAKLDELDTIEGVPTLYRRDDVRTLKNDLRCYMYLSSLKLENTYEHEFGKHIYYEEDTQAHLWEN